MSTHQNERPGQQPVGPIIGIAPDVSEPKPQRPRVQCAMTYVRAISAAGGRPIILPPLTELIPQHLEMCDGFVLTGGDDPRMEAFGERTHPKATPVHAMRQAFDTALLSALGERPDVPTLGVCLGMQMMALVAGGRLEQHLPDVLPGADGHYNDAVHVVVGSDVGRGLKPLSGPVTSHHRQAVQDAGRLRVAARSEDGVIEAIVRPDATFFVGVQWHPERTEDSSLGRGMFEQLVAHALAYRSGRARA